MPANNQSSQAGKRGANSASDPGRRKGGAAPKPDPARRRGGQPGNRNAYIHGFYARHLPRDVSWSPPPQSGCDTLEPEIHALQVLMGRLSSRLDTPDSESSDPDAPFKVILSASDCLDVLQKHHDCLQDRTLENQRWLDDMLAYQEIRRTPPTDLLTVENLEKLRMSLFRDSALPLEKYLTPEWLESYQALRAFQAEQERNDEIE